MPSSCPLTPGIITSGFTTFESFTPKPSQGDGPAQVSVRAGHQRHPLEEAPPRQQPPQQRRGLAPGAQTGPLPRGGCIRALNSAN